MRALLCLLAAVLLLAGVLVARPEWVLTPPVASWALRRIARGYHPSWRGFLFGIRSLSVEDKELFVRVCGLCFSEENRGLSGCLKTLEARAVVRLGLTGVRLQRVESFLVRGERMRVDLRRRKESSGTAAPAPLRGVKWGELEVDLPANEIVQAGGASRLDLRLAKAASAAAPLEARMSLKKRPAAYSARLSLSSDVFATGELTYARLDGSVQGEGSRARLKVRAAPAKGGALAVELQADARKGGLELALRASGPQTLKRLALSGSVRVLSSSGTLATLDPFEITADLERRALSLEASAKAGGKRRLAGELGGRLTARARLAPRRSERDRFEAEAEIVLSPITDWYQIGGRVSARVSGRASRLEAARISHRIDVEARLPRFQDLVTFLSSAPYAVPAPINVLQGPLSASIHSDGDPRQDAQEVLYRLSGDLSRGNQRLRFGLKGELTASRLLASDRRLENRAELALEDVALRLPHLDVLNMPVLRLDPRIKTVAWKGVRAQAEEDWKNAVRSSSGALRTALHVYASTPVVLYTDLAKSEVPVALDLSLRQPPGELDAAIDVRPFRMELFRRKVLIEHLRLKRRAQSKATELDGLIVYKADEATIFIRLLGNTEKPRVVLESEPPMSQEEIIAMLLYGKSPSELDSDQASAVANTQAGLSNKAFGLLSLYLFAATPVEFVGYDPATRSYRMRLRLPGGASLELGSDFTESRQGQLRKLLAPHWAIEAEVRNTPEQGNALATFLEWFGRY